MVKNGRRGSIGAVLSVRGRQAGPCRLPASGTQPGARSGARTGRTRRDGGDNGNEFFPQTTFQISNIHAGTGATNVIPGECEVLFNFRYSTETTHEILRERVGCPDRHGLDYTIEWTLSGLPFLTPRGELVDAARQAIKLVAGIETELSTAGGTSDGRFIAPTGAQVLELGPLNATIHQVDECVAVDDLDRLSAMYEKVLEHLLA